jgi:hypothetical protein
MNKLIVGVVLLLAIAACGAPPESEPSPSPTTAAPTTARTTPAPTTAPPTIQPTVEPTTDPPPPATARATRPRPAPQTTVAAANCDPNYEGACLKDGIGDYDCEGGTGDGPNYVSGRIRVVGSDPFGLDHDGNGVACENS